jgi:hypothetical protein
MTQGQINRIKDAFDILRGVFAEIREERGHSKESKRLDTILGKLENLIYLNGQK